MVSPVWLRGAIDAELHDNLLPFWRERAVDAELGGFIAEMANDGTVRTDAPRGLILNSRILWSFAALYRARGNPTDLALADRAGEYLLGHFKDSEHGGYYWQLDATGRLVDPSKKIYGQAFCIYALTELHLATGESSFLQEARHLFHLIEHHAHDDDHGGYIEVVAADWSPAADLRLSAKDMDVAKSMNNHLHVLEAYTNLYRVWPDPSVEARLQELLELFGEHIIGRDGQRCHLQHFFDRDWRVRSTTYSYGHDIEAAWLLCEAAEVVGDTVCIATAEGWAENLASSVLHEAMTPDGGLPYEGQDGQVVDPNREWWCQAEAIVGFWQAYAATGKAEFAEAASRVWRFVEDRVVDRINGEWFWRVYADGSVDENEPKVSEWKGPYHNIRMCLEMLRRIDDEE